MNLHAGYPQKVKIALFDSVNVALKRLPAKTDPERIATQRPPATATKGEVIEMVEAEAMPAHIMRALVREKVESYLEAVLKTRTALKSCQINRLMLAKTPHITDIFTLFA